MNVCSTQLTSFDASNYSHCQGVNFKWCPLSHHSTGSSRYLGFCKVRKKLLMSKMTQPSHPSFPPLPSLALPPTPQIPPLLPPYPQITSLPLLPFPPYSSNPTPPPSLPPKSHSSPLLPFPPYPSNHTPPLSCPSLPTPQITLLPSLALPFLLLKSHSSPLLPFPPYPSNNTPPLFSFPIPWIFFYRFTADEALSTQVNVFEESLAEDNQLMEMPGAVDINNHEDMFRVVFEKASDSY